MSIIYEALKKLQTSEPQRPSPKRIPFFIYIIVVILGILLARSIFTLFTKPKKIIPPLSSVNLSPPTNTLEIEEEIKPMEKEEKLLEIPTFSLSGILYSDNQKWAMINNRILKEGDTIEGAKVIGISADGVELNWKGEKIFLRLK